jgi:hypothetical protein
MDSWHRASSPRSSSPRASSPRERYMHRWNLIPLSWLNAVHPHADLQCLPLRLWLPVIDLLIKAPVAADGISTHRCSSKGYCGDQPRTLTVKLLNLYFLMLISTAVRFFLLPRLVLLILCTRYFYMLIPLIPLILSYAPNFPIPG